MSKINTDIIGSNVSFHINFINRHFKETNLNTLADFIHVEKVGIIITTNQATSVQNINTIKKILKEAKNVNQDLIKRPYLPQSKSYLKILDFYYYSENTNNPITSELVKGVIKESYIFNDIILVSKPNIIKALSSSNLAVI